MNGRWGLGCIALLLVATGWENQSLANSKPGPSGLQLGATPKMDARPLDGPAGTYGRTCGYCHGANVGPVLLGRGLPADAVKAIARMGMGTMPAFRPTEINDAELDALARWIETSAADPAEHGR